MRYRIGSFNVRNLKRSSDRDLEWIAAIIKNTKMDVVALQEVLGEGNVLKGSNYVSASNTADYSLLNWLGANKWRSAWRYPRPNHEAKTYIYNDKRDEGYAFLWNTDRVQLPEEDGEPVEPRIWKNYHTNKDLGGIRLIRDPCYARFQLKALPRVEFRLVSTHIVFGKPKNEISDIEVDAGAIGMRNNEFNILAGKIYPRISEYYKYERCNVPYTILLGDYNLNLTGSAVSLANIPQIVCFDEKGRRIPAGSNYFCKINNFQSGLSTINQNNTGLANNYDHFSCDERTQNSIYLRTYVVDWDNEQKYGRFFRKYSQSSDVNEKYAIYKSKVSDHLPVVIELEF